jgi:hypothetical protein
VNLYKIREAKDAGGDLFRSIQRQKDQYQGIWIVSPEGKVLAGHHEIANQATWSQEVLNTIGAALKSFGPGSPRQAQPVNPIPHRGFGVDEDGGVTLALYVRTVRGGGRPTAPAPVHPTSLWLWDDELKTDGPPVIDSLPLNANDWATLTPPQGAVGTEWPIPESIARKFARTLSPSSDQSTMPRPEDATVAEMKARVEEVNEGQARIRFTGRWATKHVYDGKPSYGWATADGIGLYDSKKHAMRSLLLTFGGAFRMVPPYDKDDRPTGAVAEWKSAAPEARTTTPTRLEGDGIAGKYRGDRGIDRDPAVVFAENFEVDSIDALKKRYDNVQAAETMSFTKDTPSGSSGKSSLLMTHVGGKGTGGHLYRRLLPGYEKLYGRFYVKFDPNCFPIHHFGTHLGGFNPPTPWPQGGAGERPRGDERITVGIEPFGDAWRWDYYAYWGEMRGSPPRGQNWGNSFIRDPALKVEMGKWTCVEFMIHMNDPGEHNGELALWIDGKPVSHLSKGSPRGRWVFDKFEPGKGGDSIRWSDKTGGPEHFNVAEGGEPFEGFRWRTDKALNINYIWTYLYITDAPAGHVSKVWFDDIVIAKEYIGPLKQ